MQIAAGRVIGDKYRLVCLLGRGSMGEVWSAHHVTLGEHVALKLMRTADPSDDDDEGDGAANARFQFEAQLAARLSRKTRHIVQVTDHGEADGLAYLVMELLEGETLEHVLDREGRLELSRLANIVRQVARALGQAHAEGVAHRDLKPANVFLTRDEDGQLVAKLLDFGIARAIHVHKAPSAYATAQGRVFGTPSYMSPEQARGSKRLDQRCDLWALATIAYEAACAELPVEGRDGDEVMKNLCAGRIVPIARRLPQLGETLGAFFEKAFADGVDDRFQTAAELAAAFDQAVGSSLRELPVTELSPESVPVFARTSAATPPSSPARRRAPLALAFALLTLLAVGVVGWRALAGGRHDPVPTGAVAATLDGRGATGAPLQPGATVALAASTDSLAAPPPTVPASSLPVAPPSPPASSGRRGTHVAPTGNPRPGSPGGSASAKKDRSEVF